MFQVNWWYGIDWKNNMVNTSTFLLLLYNYVLLYHYLYKPLLIVFILYKQVLEEYLCIVYYYKLLTFLLTTFTVVLEQLQALVKLLKAVNLWHHESCMLTLILLRYISTNDRLEWFLVKYTTCTTYLYPL